MAVSRAAILASTTGSSILSGRPTDTRVAATCSRNDRSTVVKAGSKGAFASELTVLDVLDFKARAPLEECHSVESLWDCRIGPFHPDAISLRIST